MIFFFFLKQRELVYSCASVFCVRVHALGAAVCGAQFSGGEKTDEGAELG